VFRVVAIELLRSSEYLEVTRVFLIVAMGLLGCSEGVSRE